MNKLLRSCFQQGTEIETWGNEWEGNDQDEIVAFYCFGNSEMNEEIVAKIKKYQAGKDYILGNYIQV